MLLDRHHLGVAVLSSATLAQHRPALRAVADQFIAWVLQQFGEYGQFLVRTPGLEDKAVGPACTRSGRRSGPSLIQVAEPLPRHRRTARFLQGLQVQ
jgi:hypothetical protein